MKPCNFPIFLATWNNKCPCNRFQKTATASNIWAECSGNIAHKNVWGGTSFQFESVTHFQREPGTLISFQFVLSKAIHRTVTQTKFICPSQHPPPIPKKNMLVLLAFAFIAPNLCLTELFYRLPFFVVWIMLRDWKACNWLLIHNPHLFATFVCDGLGLSCLQQNQTCSSQKFAHNMVKDAFYILDFGFRTWEQVIAA